MDDECETEKFSQAQLEGDHSSGDGRPPSINALGLGGEPDPDEYQVGQRLECRIVAARQGGYDVVIVKDVRRAFLRTDRQHEEGALVIGEFRFWQWK